MQSKDGNAKLRYIQDVIDNIFKDEAQESAENIKKITADINRWARNNELPINPKSTFIKKERDEDRRIKRKEKETLLNVPVDVNAETDAQKLKRVYDIKIKDEKNGPVGAQISSFCVSEGAYM